MGQRDYKDLDDKFAAAFKLARVHAELSQEAVADRMRDLGFDVSQPVIGKIERGQRRVSIGEAEALSATVNKPLSALLAGPHSLKLEWATSELRRLRDNVKTSIVRFQSGQQALAIYADAIAGNHGLDEFDAEEVQYQILESIEDVLAELRKDTIADSVARRHRESLEPDGDPSRSPGPDRPLNDESYLGRLMAAFGDEVSYLADGEVFASMFGAQGGPETATDAGDEDE